MKRKYIIVSLLIWVALAPLSLADTSTGQPRQIAYELQLFELNQSDVQILGIALPDSEAVEALATESGIRLISSPGLIQILRAGAELFQVGITNEQVMLAAQANPSITVVMGETGRLSLVTQRWFRDNFADVFSADHYGLQLALTPLRADYKGESILTAVELSTSQANTLQTSVWTANEEVVPLGVLVYKVQTSDASLFSLNRQAETRFFAVYLKARTIQTIAREPIVNIGSLGGLSEILWLEEAKRPSSVTLDASLTRVEFPELKLDWWLSKTIKLGVGTSQGASSWKLTLGSTFFEQDLLLQGELFMRSEANELRLGVTDRVEINHNLALSAGLYPLRFNINKRSLEPGLVWWGQLEYSQEKYYGSVAYDAESGDAFWQGTIGYYISPQDLATLSVRTDFEQLLRLSIGYRREF